jgi:polyisoprenoid-binding protein YceI
MRKTIILTTLMALLLAACATPASAPAPAATAAPAAPVAASTDVPAAASSTAESTAAPEAGIASTNTAGPVTYQIVPAESKVTYSVGETFINDGNRFNTAVGTTQQVSGEVVVDRSTPANSKLGKITVDISTFQSDSGRRDNTIRSRFLESSKYPQAVFDPQSVEGLPTAVQEGMDIPFKVSGNLTVRDVTKPVTFDVTLRLDGQSLTGTAATQIKMSDFGFGPIDMGGILKTEDDVKVTFDFVARPVTSAQ